MRTKELKEIGVSWIRTSLVPPAVGYIMTTLVDHKITSISAAWVTTALTLLFSGIYYLVLRAVEILASKPQIQRLAGIFLGYSRQDKWVK